MAAPKQDLVTGVPTRWWRPLDDGRSECTVCPRRCRLRPNQRGMCFVRGRGAGPEVLLTTYGRSSGFCVDPIEKKPLAHFLPGTPVLSFGTAGCNLACRFCQNWDISKSRELDTLMDAATPEAIAEAAKRAGAKSVAFTYNDPAIFLEYAVDTAKAAHALGLKTVAVSAGYIEPGPRAELYAHLDAANIDLKGFTEAFYEKLCAGQLAPVLDTLEYLVHETEVWTEITTLVIPGWNDSDAELAAECRWIGERLGPEVPLHFSAFHPDFRMRDVPPTPVSTLRRAREIALAAGLRYVYTGNVHDPGGEVTVCPGCGVKVIERDWYAITGWRLDDVGRCAACGTPIAGVFAGPPGDWGRRRLPVRPGGPAPPADAEAGSAPPD